MNTLFEYKGEPSSKPKYSIFINSELVPWGKDWNSILEIEIEIEIEIQ